MSRIEKTTTDGRHGAVGQEPPDADTIARTPSKRDQNSTVDNGGMRDYVRSKERGTESERDRPGAGRGKR